MKVFSSEYCQSYSTYTFGYAQYAVSEAEDDIPEIYEQGFLPFTGIYSIDRPVFYRARSFRIDVTRFTATSENRRVVRQAAALDLEVICVPIESFEVQEQRFQKFCTAYAEERFSGGSMSAERLQYILSLGLVSHVLVFRSEKYGDLGYVLTVIRPGMLHYWFAFFDTDYLTSHSIGKYIMFRTISWAQAQGINNVYLGTTYGHKALYKIRDHRGGEFWDGYQWNTDIKLLKERCKTDDQARTMDRFKEMKLPEAYIRTMVE